MSLVNCHIKHMIFILIFEITLGFVSSLVTGKHNGLYIYIIIKYNNYFSYKYCFILLHKQFLNNTVFVLDNKSE